MEKTGYKAHALILPYPAQGHINPMLQFAKRLVSKQIKCTLAITVHISNSMHSDADPNSSIAIETISDGYDDGRLKQTDSDEAYIRSLNLVGSHTLEKLIRKLDDIGQPVTVLIYDGFLPWGLDVAKRFGLLGVAFFTQSCAVNNIYYHVNKGLLPVPLSNPIVSVPGLPAIKASETPTYIHDFGSDPVFYDVLVNQFSNIDQADWVLFNTFYFLEQKVIDYMSKTWNMGTVGPTLLSMYLDKRLEDDKDYGINLFKPKTSACLSWLTDKPRGSVVYVSFGSMAEVTPEQMIELAWGFRRANYYFLWVVRESEQTKLPHKFTEEVSGKGLIVSWCPQLEVLSHESVGCFVTHCGFNSVVEALSFGVPIVAMPQFSDQTTNAMFVEEIWGIGLRAQSDRNGTVRREMIHAFITKVMEGDNGKEIKKNACMWKNLAKEAIDEGGSSDKNIDQFVAKLQCSAVRNSNVSLNI